MSSARLRSDDGRVSLFFAVLTIGILAMIGLAVDGGAKMRALQRADQIAAEAARAGGQAIDLPQAIVGGRKVVDPGKAAAAAREYLNAAGVDGTVSVAEDGRSLHVTVTISFDTTVLSIIGVTGLSATGEATAILIDQ